MNHIKEHITFKILTLLLAVVLLVPTVVKFTHILTHHDHEHEICSGEKTTHLHEIDLECEFYKFKLNNHYFFSIQFNDLVYVVSYYKLPFLTYKFLNNHQLLSFSLRGPPALV
ncbi:hypothetical protein A8C32_01090 [Flavivirga aquatica]|uniref:Uncharacterized protein n=1 Tax=Flavivirga aquatica TaxID=1849968 RepID=A0A1E5TC30_9FLAO|nr:hypothetical protein [Flavivirga aquatica]OEK08899.1 hypothetical protein A8C32_01090 [Flavivirga aquatica]